MRPNVLVIDSIYLVAMDIERILADTLGCNVHLGTPLTILQDLAAGSFEVVVVEIDNALGNLQEVVDRVSSTGASLVFSTTNSEYSAGLPALADYPVLVKPFDEGQLVNLIASRVSRSAGQSMVQSIGSP